MRKKSKPSKSDLLYIQVNPEKMSIKQLSDELELSEKAITKVLDNLKPTETEVQVVEQPKVAPAKSDVDNSRFMQTLGKSKRNEKTVAVVMTEGASSVGDDNRKKNNMSKKMESAIFRPKG